MFLVSRAAKAQKEGWFDREIVPVKTVLKDKDGNEKPVVVSINTQGPYLQKGSSSS